MSAATDTPSPVQSARSAARFLFWASIVLICAWVLLPIYLLMVNALFWWNGRAG